MGDRGRVVLPAEVRARLHLEAGDRLVLIEDADGLVLMTRDQLKRAVRRDYAGAGDLVSELLSERRRAAALEDSGTS